jgi:predicted Zn-dependent peptidase
VVGDVTLDALRKVANTYFRDVPADPPPDPSDVVEPEQKAERRVILEEAAQPMLVAAWHVPAARDPSYPAYEALTDLLAGGDYARLNKALVKERKIAVQVEGFIGVPGEKYPNLMGIYVVPAAGQDPARVEAAMDQVIEQVRTRAPFTAAELHGYQVRVRADRIRAVDANSNLAENLATYQTLFGDWREFFREQERIQALTPADVMNAIRTRMVRRNSTVGTIVNPRPAGTAR